MMPQNGMQAGPSSLSPLAGSYSSVEHHQAAQAAAAAAAAQAAQAAAGPSPRVDAAGAQVYSAEEVGQIVQQAVCQREAQLRSEFDAVLQKRLEGKGLQLIAVERHNRSLLLPLFSCASDSRFSKPPSLPPLPEQYKTFTQYYEDHISRKMSSSAFDYTA
jgi:hypothetical protein